MAYKNYYKRRYDVNGKGHPYWGGRWPKGRARSEEDKARKRASAYAAHRRHSAEAQALVASVVRIPDAVPLRHGSAPEQCSVEQVDDVGGVPPLQQDL